MTHQPEGQPPSGNPKQVKAEVMSFALIGVAGLLVDMGALWVAMNPLGLDKHSAGFFSYFVAATFTWWMNRRFTFTGASRRRALHQWAKFLAANAVGGVVNLSVYNLIVWLDAPAFAVALLPWLPALWPYGAKGAGSLAGMGFNFVLSKMLVFGHKAPRA
ncbi:GtrA family protein [Nitrospirillum sp. BR 11828]|uniref:GtrA family protein n=1 Tax=Nitrospirillum sp. BR 11828 TaxID=3104325 RepID=UPI002AC9F5D7|nr:GtrA family protein [Nitrospirillum sp. BR 11828]MDZ5647252.1 GtrA family protein [Nitrospirillum sp. BR 11828]